MVEEIMLFQFLIGTIKTRYGIIGKIEDLMFQFLIGTIKTKFKGFVLFMVKEFQFLIGTIKTDKDADKIDWQPCFNSL